MFRWMKKKKTALKTVEKPTLVVTKKFDYSIIIIYIIIIFVAKNSVWKTLLNNINKKKIRNVEHTTFAYKNNEQIKPEFIFFYKTLRFLGKKYWNLCALQSLYLSFLKKVYALWIFSIIKSWMSGSLL